MNTVDEILDYAIDQEQQAADFYTHLAGRAEKAGIRHGCSRSNPASANLHPNRKYST